MLLNTVDAGQVIIDHLFRIIWYYYTTKPKPSKMCLEIKLFTVYDPKHEHKISPVLAQLTQDMLLISHLDNMLNQECWKQRKQYNLQKKWSSSGSGLGTF